MTAKEVSQAFSNKFKQEPKLSVLSPGRINLIGEHTDYNEGFVLPAAINYHISISLSPNGTDSCNVYSMDFDEMETFDLASIEESDKKWLNYIMGVAYQVSEKVSGFDMVVKGDIPVGAGLSSSAALCCGTIFALSHAFDLHLDRWEMTRIAQKSEHDFIHVNCGIMDQFVCIFGKSEHALLLDCMTLTYDEMQFDLSGQKLLLLNSNVEHALDDSEYNNRRNESAQALSAIVDQDKNIKSYQDLDLEKLCSYNGAFKGIISKRAKHIVTENTRVHKLSKALKNRSFEYAGELLTQSHYSLRDDYEVTCKETDYIVEELIKYDTVFGARQTGGGFGGCVLALAKNENVENIIANIDHQYQNKFGINLTYIPIVISKGCHIVTN